MNHTSNTHYSALAKLLHWLIALMVIVLGGVGLYMSDLKISPDKIKLYAMHKSFGLTVLALMAVRLWWRWKSPPPPSVPMPPWQSQLATLTHVALYGLLIVMPLSGWLLNSAANFPLRWFNLFAVPDIAAPSESLKEWAKEVHEIAFWILAVLVILHIAAAIKHHWIDRDDTLRRMLPFARNKQASKPSDPP